MKKIAILFFSIIFSLIFIEFLLNIFGYKKKQLSLIESVKNNASSVVLDINRIYKLNDGLLTDDFHLSDKFGFRYSLSHEKYLESDYKSAIFFIGDSFVYGHGVSNEDTIPVLFEKQIKKNKVINAGVPGYGIDQEFLYLFEIIKKYEPKVIYWGVNINDIFDSNYKCLYKKIGFNKYINLPGFLNIYFIRNFIVEKISISIFEYSNIMDILISNLRSIGEGGYYTIGCTSGKSYVKRVPEILKKYDYFFEEIEKLSLNSKPEYIFLLMPTQMYFDKKFKNSDLEYGYFEIRNYLNSKNYKFIDLNVDIAKKFDPELLNYRKLGGDSFFNGDLSCYRNLGFDLFLQDDPSDNGHKHLNKNGNQIVSDILLTYEY